MAPFTSDCVVQILNHFSKAVLSVVNGNRVSPRLLPHALRDLAKLEPRPPRLTKIAYEWCLEIYANREKFEDWENLLLVCLDLGFRHLDLSKRHHYFNLAHTEHHWGLVDVVFKSQQSEAIADLLHAWTDGHSLPESVSEMVGICAEHLVGLHNLISSSPRLRRLVLRFVELVGYKGFESTGLERFIELLDHLHPAVEEMDSEYRWSSLLLDVIRSPEGPRHLSNRYWELLMEFAASGSWLDFGDTDTLKIAKFLIDAEEWGKLECWIGTVWMSFDSAGVVEEDLEYQTLLLLRQRPGAAQKLEQWMERWCQECGEDIPEAFRRILTQAHEAVQRQDAL